MQANLAAALEKQVIDLGAKMQASFAEQFGVLTDAVNKRIDENTAGIKAQSEHSAAIHAQFQEHP
eukprot:3617192-Pyramimonas_sp.AAC.1